MWAVREGSAADLSPWLVDGSLYVHLCSQSLPVCVSVSEFPFFIRTPVILKKGYPNDLLLTQLPL